MAGDGTAKGTAGAARGEELLLMAEASLLLTDSPCSEGSGWKFFSTCDRSGDLREVSAVGVLADVFGLAERLGAGLAGEGEPPFRSCTDLLSGGDVDGPRFLGAREASPSEDKERLRLVTVLLGLSEDLERALLSKERDFLSGDLGLLGLDVDLSRR